MELRISRLCIGSTQISCIIGGGAHNLTIYPSASPLAYFATSVENSMVPTLPHQSPQNHRTGVNVMLDYEGLPQPGEVEVHEKLNTVKINPTPVLERLMMFQVNRPPRSDGIHFTFLRREINVKIAEGPAIILQSFLHRCW